MKVLDNGEIMDGDVRGGSRGADCVVGKEGGGGAKEVNGGDSVFDSLSD